MLRHLDMIRWLEEDVSERQAQLWPACWWAQCTRKFYNVHHLRVHVRNLQGFMVSDLSCRERARRFRSNFSLLAPFQVVSKSSFGIGKEICCLKLSSRKFLFYDIKNTPLSFRKYSQFHRKCIDVRSSHLKSFHSLNIYSRIFPPS